MPRKAAARGPALGGLHRTQEAAVPYDLKRGVFSNAASTQLGRVTESIVVVHIENFGAPPFAGKQLPILRDF